MKNVKRELRALRNTKELYEKELLSAKELSAIRYWKGRIVELSKKIGKLLDAEDVVEFEK